MISNFKYWINNRFEGCVHIASTRDPYRSRDVQIFAMPGEWEIVGISDGVDRWIAPISARPFIGHGVDVRKLMEELRAGTLTAPVDSRTTRHRIIIDSSKRPPEEQPFSVGHRPAARKRIGDPGIASLGPLSEAIRETAAKMREEAPAARRRIINA